MNKAGNLNLKGDLYQEVDLTETSYLDWSAGLNQSGR